MAYNNRNLFLISPEAEKSKIKLPDSVSGRSLLSGSQTAMFLLCPHVVEGTRWSLFYKGPHPGTFLVVQWFKNPPANAGDVGLIPGPGTKIPRAAGQLSLCATTTEARAFWNLCSKTREAA